MGLSTRLTHENIVEFLAIIYHRDTQSLYPGEQITVAQHMLQCASIAEQQGEGDTVVVAALLHDVGHLICHSDHLCLDLPDDNLSDSDQRHEEAGAVLLGKYFPQAVVDAVRFHVMAKRYLCTTEPGYIGHLSPASAGTLAGQGGLMTEVEVHCFQQKPHLDTNLKVRRIDDKANAPDFEHPDFLRYGPMIRRVLTTPG